MQFLTGSMISVVICVAAFVWMKKHPGKQLPGALSYLAKLRRIFCSA